MQSSEEKQTIHKACEHIQNTSLTHEKRKINIENNSSKAQNKQLY